MAQKSFVIRHMTEQEMTLPVDWAAAEGWNPGLHDAQCFWDADPQGFLVGYKDGQPVGCISAVRYGASYGFIGFYMVKPAWRGQGYGLQLWQKAMKQLAGRVVGLDGVVAQQENYQKSGFQLAYRNIRYGGVFSDQLLGIIRELRTDVSIVPVKEVDQAKLDGYDSNLFLAARKEFLSSWLRQEDATALVAVCNTKIVGYGVIRRCRSGWKIGPLFAEDLETAEKLLLSLAANAKGDEVFFDVPEVNAAAVNLAVKYKMTKVFETARMYNGAAPQVDMGKVFGVTTFELG